MISKATIFKATTLPAADFNLLEALQASAFQPCMPSQEASAGWTAPNNGEMCESLNGQLIMQYTTEVKRIPADIVKRKVAQFCKDSEALTGRKPNKARKAEIKADVMRDLTLTAFPARTATKCWIDPVKQMVIVDAAPKRAAEVASALVNTITGLALESLTIQPTAAMTSWLSGQTEPSCMDVGIDCELIATDESKTKVKYIKHNLDIPEVVDHIMSGMTPKSLGFLWGDRVYFVLNDDMSLSKIEFIDQPEIDEAKDTFEASAYIATTEINDLVQDLIEELS
jgi:recombination associated protein RdgC